MPDGEFASIECRNLLDYCLLYSYFDNLLNEVDEDFERAIEV